MSKSSGHFATYKQQFAKETSFVSRRHAHIYARGQDLYIEDLGSTNGTLLNGRRLDGTAEKLSADDTLQFGHELFTFKVALEAAPVQDNQAVATRRTVPEGTILVSRAASFLDIYCDTPEPESEMPEPESAPVRADAAGTAQCHGWPRDRVRNWQQLAGQRSQLSLVVMSLAVVAVRCLTRKRACWNNSSMSGAGIVEYLARIPRTNRCQRWHQQQGRSGLVHAIRRRLWVRWHARYCARSCKASRSDVRGWTNCSVCDRP
ncbi:MAG: FHA domain-containing protein [Pseudohongiellaceae bacterium]